MLDTRSGQLLTSQSFSNSFSQLQFAGEGLSYLLHKNGDPGQELIELHHLSLLTNTTSLITSYIHSPQPKVRPSLWRGSLSRDGARFVYQPDVLKPSITVADGHQGHTLCTIRWQENLTPLPVYMDSTSDLILIPLARWDAQYNYADERLLLLANLKTGEILGKYPMPHTINHVRFQGKSIILVNTANQMARLTPGSPDIVWNPVDESIHQGMALYLYAGRKAAGFLSRIRNDDPGEFLTLCDDEQAPFTRFAIEKNFVPVSVQNNMLVTEKYVNHDLPDWLASLNGRFATLCGRYLISPQDHVLRFQDIHTGQLLGEKNIEQHDISNWASRRCAGSTILASVFLDGDHLRVEFSSLFPFWSIKSLAFLALVLTLFLNKRSPRPVAGGPPPGLI